MSCNGVSANWFETEHPVEMAPCKGCDTPTAERFNFDGVPGHEDEVAEPYCTGCGVGLVMRTGLAGLVTVRRLVDAVKHHQEAKRG